MSCPPLTMSHSLTPSPLSGSDKIVVITDATPQDLARARQLAKALNGRWIPAHGGWCFRQRDALRWVELFDAGFTARRRGVPGWWFQRPGERAMYDRYGVVRQLKREAA